jgi:2-polyprenyl-6-methoxyphenol hydroxylase-like FAD-dependent oxidoreductase
VILGDAAHASKPNGGQGGSLSLEDADTLALTVAKANTKDSFADARETLSRWDNARVQRIEHVANASMTMGMHMGPDDPFAEESWTKENDQLFWLYGYDTDDINNLL